MNIEEIKARVGSGFGKKTKKKKRFHYGYSLQNIADLTGYKLSSIKAKVKNGYLNPKSLESVVRFIASILILNPKQEKVSQDNKS